MKKENHTNLLKKIDSYVKGELRESEIDELWHEFAKDPSLLDYLEIETGLRKILKEKSSLVSQKKGGIRKLSDRAWYATAAAAVILVALVQFFRAGSSDEWVAYISETISIEQLEFADGLRSGEQGNTTPDSLLNLGFEAAYSGNTSKAIEFYETVIKNYDREPYASKAYLNTGIIQYNKRQFEAAAASFNEAVQRAGDNRIIAEKAYWFLANTHVLTGDFEQAFSAAEQAYSKNGVFRERAFLLYRKLGHELEKIDFDDFESQIERYNK